MEFLNRKRRHSLQPTLRSCLPSFKQVASVAGLLLLSANVLAATSVTQLDVNGADDEPGQKDLNAMTTTYDTGDGFDFHVLWNWDDTSVSGGNTVDACSLYDTDGDGFANYSLCVTGGGTPITYQSTTLYSCDDSRVDRCAGPTVLNTDPPAPYLNSVCTIQSATDPFHAGSNDTQAMCKIKLSDLGTTAIPVLTNVCSYPSQEPNSDPSDCVVAPTDGFIKVTKLAANAGSQTFPVTLNPTLPTDYTTLTPLVPSVTQTIAVPKGTYSLTEAIPSGWQIDDITCTLGTSAFSSDPNMDMLAGIPVEAGRLTTCTVTNSKKMATLKLVKTVINDNGGTATTADFTPSVNGTAKTWNTVMTLNAGTYTLAETSLAGYKALGWSCGADATDPTKGQVTLNAGDAVTCTITNDDIAPQLKVIKKVINDNGGTKTAADFTMNVAATNASHTSFAGSETGVTVTLNAGSYNVTETNVAGYAATYSNCSGSIALGETKTCTIINNDIAPTLKLIKTVVNDNGGTATASNFTPSVDGTAKSWNTVISLNAGAHKASETNLAGYKASAWGGDCSADGSVTLALGEAKTCTITNDDIAPTLTLRKKIANNLYIGSQGDSATQWTLNASPLISANGVLIAPDTAQTNTYTAKANTVYTLSEMGGPSGYTASAWSCSTGGSLSGNQLTLALGAKVTCTITNTYKRVCETAFSSGTKTLQSLIGTNRWGWAIELKTYPITKTYTIYAGQTDPVGTFTVSWNGSQATLTVKLDSDWSSQGIHLYGGDKPPTTAAPGQFNLNTAKWTLIAPNTYKTTVSLIDSADLDGAWLVLHMDTCEAKL